jgi:hypothetical protein
MRLCDFEPTERYVKQRSSDDKEEFNFGPAQVTQIRRRPSVASGKDLAPVATQSRM